MFDSKWKYFVAGIVLCLAMALILSAGDPPDSGVGRYQIAATTHASSAVVFIADTKTGVVKYVCNLAFPGAQQLGIPFEEMSTGK